MYLSSGVVFNRVLDPYTIIYALFPFYNFIKLGIHIPIDTNAHSVHSEDRKKDVSDWKKGPSNKDWSKVKHAKIKVEEKSWIGFNSIITKGVVLNEGTIIGCGSVVTESTEPFGVYAGNPAIFIKKSD